MKKNNKQRENTEAKLDWWYRYADSDLTSMYFGDNGKRYFNLDLESLNGGKKLRFVFLLYKDLQMSGTMDEVYLEIYDRKDCNDYGTLEAVYKLGDIAFDELVGFASVLLKILKPEMLVKKEFNKIADPKEVKI